MGKEARQLEGEAAAAAAATGHDDKPTAASVMDHVHQSPDAAGSSAAAADAKGIWLEPEHTQASAVTDRDAAAMTVTTALMMP